LRDSVEIYAMLVGSVTSVMKQSPLYEDRIYLAWMTNLWLPHWFCWNENVSTL